MTISDRGVPRGDNVKPGEQEKAAELQQSEAPESSADRADAALEAQNPKPDFTKGTDRGGSAGWGSEASGGSTFDKRSPEKVDPTRTDATRRPGGAH